MDELLRAYARLTQRTVLRPTVLPSMPPEVVTQLPSDANAAVRFIEVALLEKRLELIPDGEKFMRIVPGDWSNSPAATFLATIKPADPAGEDFPAGSLDWSGSGGADFLQALEFYSKLRTCTLLRSAQLQSPTLKLTTSTSLTRGELCHGLTVLLALNGIAAIDDGEKFVQLVPVREWRSAKARAPRTEEGEALLVPKALSSPAPQPPSVAVNRLTQVYQEFFQHERSWMPRSVDRLVEFYAELTGQKAAPSEYCGRWPAAFEITTPLTREETCYAVETTLKLHNVALVKDEDGKLTAIPLAELRSREAREATARAKQSKP